MLLKHEWYLAFVAFRYVLPMKSAIAQSQFFRLHRQAGLFFGGAVSYLLSDRVPLAVVEVINNQHPCSHRAPSGIVLHSFPTVFHVGPHPHRYNPFFKAAFSLLNLRIR